MLFRSDPRAAILLTIAADPLLRERLAGATFQTTPVVIGPLAVDARPPSFDGLLVAGDAAGFVDPITGDGLRFAIRGAEFAAAAALEALTSGWDGVHERLARTRRTEFGAKWRFNRAVRTLVASPGALALASAGARVAPGVLRQAMVYAGDCAC